jgi:sugar lactone lactonase YvrE
VTGSDEVHADVAVDVRPEVGEAPHWDDATQTLWFVDLTGGSVFRYAPHGGTVSEFAVGQEVGAAIPRVDGGLVLAVRDGIAVTTEGGGGFEIVAPIERERRSNRMNDAKCDPAGRLFAGTTAFDFTPRSGALYRIDPDWSYRRVVGDVTTSNGLAWSPDGSRMYFIDSATQGVDVLDYDVATGSIGRRTRLVTIPVHDGVPDGMTVDVDGALWVACFGAGAVRCYSASGKPVRAIQLPVSQVTSCAFGGADLSDLYVTSACYRLTAEQRANEPLAGATFVCKPGVAGHPVSRFAGPARRAGTLER